MLTHFACNRMADHTRSGQDESAGPGEGLPLPPPPTMAEVLLQIERNRSEDKRLMLEVLARTTSALTGASGSGHGGGHQPCGGLAEFLRTQPPTFSSSEDPLDAAEIGRASCRERV